jgi:Protein of unknown function (DUF2541)
MRCSNFVFTLLIGMGLLATASAAVAAPVDALGCRKVGFGVDRDVIAIGRQSGRYAAIKLTVAQNAIEILDVGVVYGNGNPDQLAVRSLISPGGQTRWIDLNGNRRLIRQVSLVYRSIPNFKGQATVCAFGRRFN